MLLIFREYQKQLNKLVYSYDVRGTNNNIRETFSCIFYNILNRYSWAGTSLRLSNMRNSASMNRLII